MIKVTEIRPLDPNAKKNGYKDYVRATTRGFLNSLGYVYVTHIKGNTLEIVKLHRPVGKKKNYLESKQVAEVAKLLKAHLESQATLVHFKMEVE
jgi:hypothetical protein